MSLAPTSGFFPASGGAGATAGSAMDGGKSAADGPLGLFGALLDLVSAIETNPAPTARETSTGPGHEPAAALGALLNQLPTGTETDEAASIIPNDDGPEAKALPGDLLTELSDILEAIGVAAEAAMPLDPVLEQQAADLIESIAVALGVPLPIVKAAEIVAPVVAGLASGAADAIGAAANPNNPPPGQAAANTTAGDLPELPAPAAAPQTPAATRAQAGDAQTPPPIAGEPAADAPDLPPMVRELADKLAKFATAIEPKAPALAERIAALGTKIAAGDIDLSVLASLRPATPGVRADDTADPAVLQRLLAATPDAKPAAAASPFAPASLDVPLDLASQPKFGTDKVARTIATQHAGSTPAGPDTTEDGAPRSEPRSIAGVERAEPQVQRPTTPAPAPTSAGAATPADTAGSATPGNASVAATPAPAAIVTADAKAIHAAYAAPVRQINVPQVAFEIARQVQAGATRFQIRLDPPELGRIDVKLDMDAKGNVNARMTVDRAETLDLMQRDHRALERALAQAGLDSSKTNLEFSLRQNPFSHQEHQQRQGNGGSPWAPLGGGLDPDAAALPPPHLAAYRGTASPGGINLFV